MRWRCRIKGGATSVCNSRAAYEALPDEVKQKIAGAKTENTLISSARMKTEAILMS